MKKLLLITGTIVFIGNITGQRTTETVNVIIGGPIVDYGDIGHVVQIEDPITIQAISCPEKRVDVIACDLGDNKITIVGIERIPSPTGDAELVEALSTLRCPIIIEKDIPVSTNGDFGDPNGGVVERESQGPFTGLGGHNFIEDPAIIYPNPVKDVLNIKSTDPITVIEILGIHGQVELELDPRSTMDVSTLAAGTYYARIHFENIKEVQVEKILVVK